MKNCIILTKTQADGDKLKKILAIQSVELSDISCYTKGNLHELADVEFIFSTWYMPNFSETEIEKYFPNLKALFYAAGTVKYFAEPFLKKGITVYSAASANGIPVAEFTVSQIVLANKGYFQAQKAYRWPIWTRGFNNARHKAEAKYGNYDATIGIIGCGAIGSRVVELLEPYKLNILTYDPYLKEERAQLLGVKKVELADLFTSADVISNHLPDIPSTIGMINYSLLSTMKPTATLINTGRGHQIVEKDLAKVMRANKNMCALLDVTTHEPMLPWNPLYFCKNVFLSPHISGSFSNEFRRMVEYMIDAYHDTLERKQNPCKVKMDQLSYKA